MLRLAKIQWMLIGRCEYESYVTETKWVIVKNNQVKSPYYIHDDCHDGEIKLAAFEYILNTKTLCDVLNAANKQDDDDDNIELVSHLKEGRYVFKTFDSAEQAVGSHTLEFED